MPTTARQRSTTASPLIPRPPLPSTYAYGSPVVAMFLEWALADKPITLQTPLAAAIITASVALVTIGTQQSSA